MNKPTIAKYRKDGRPGEWWITDFTMEQVEQRIATLEVQLAGVTAERDGLGHRCDELVGKWQAMKDECAARALGLAGVVEQRDTLRAALTQCVEALREAKQFISNGIAFGYIAVPTSEPESNTLDHVVRALAHAQAVLKG